MLQPEPCSQPAHYSPTEAVQAIKGLSDRDKATLLKGARAYARICQSRYDYEDLLHEAIARVLEGSRKWPRAVPFLSFLFGVMRGIAWDSRDHCPEGEPEPPAAKHHEGEVIARIDTQKLIALFGDDPVAQKLVVGMLEGARGQDLWQSIGLTQTDYESKRKKIRRRIERLWFQQDAKTNYGHAIHA
jgi:RNA polymerase sigma-70 factor (ECF subfamily)